MKASRIAVCFQDRLLTELWTFHFVREHLHNMYGIQGTCSSSANYRHQEYLCTLAVTQYNFSSTIEYLFEHKRPTFTYRHTSLTPVQQLSFPSFSVERRASSPPASASLSPSSLLSSPECWPVSLEPQLTSPFLNTHTITEWRLFLFDNFFLMLTIFIHVYWIWASRLGFWVGVNFPRTKLSRVIRLFPLMLLGLSSEWIKLVKTLKQTRRGGDLQ